MARHRAPGPLDDRSVAADASPAYVDMLLSMIRAPERRFWKAFSKLLGGRFLDSHRDTLLNLVFIPHQACLMADAVVRTLWRRYVSHANLLEWETHGAIGNCGWAAILPLRRLSLRFVADLAAFSFHCRSSPDPGPAGVCRLDHRAPGGGMAE